jgi:hypothetical protein
MDELEFLYFYLNGIVHACRTNLDCCNLHIHQAAQYAALLTYMDSSIIAKFFVQTKGVTARVYPASLWVPSHPSHNGICALVPERPSDLIFFKTVGLCNSLVFQAPV